MTISGSGEMEDYTQTIDSAPWSAAQHDIQTAVIEPGVTSIGAYGFSGCSNMKSVTLPESVISIGRGRFLVVPA